jgi:hypothetical protein
MNRKCKNPNCNNFLNQKQVSYCCRSCQAKTISLGKKHSAQTKLKMSNSHSNRYKGLSYEQRYGKEIADKLKEKLWIGKNNPVHKIQNKSEWKKNLRIKALEKIFRNGGFLVGNREKELLDLQEQKDACKILRQWNTGIGYIVDGYCSENNTVYEVYEPAHYQNFDQIEKGLIRQNRIVEHLKCNFEVIYDLRKCANLYKFTSEAKNWFDKKNEELEQIRENIR